LESPLHAFGLSARVQTPTGNDRIVLAELPHMGYLVLRGKPDDSDFMQAVAGVLGQALPTKPMTVLPTAAGVVLWVSPDEWLLVCKRSRRDALMGSLTSAVQGLFAQIVDNSGGLTSMRLAGPDHMQLLRQLGPYDYESLAVGRSASTVVSKTGLTVVRTDTSGVLLVFRRSFADYTWRLLERTAQSYRPCITSPQHCADPVFSPLFETV
jgi:sarcosine oxidase subunit gamma